MIGIWPRWDNLVFVQGDFREIFFPWRILKKVWNATASTARSTLTIEFQIDPSKDCRNSDAKPEQNEKFINPTGSKKHTARELALRLPVVEAALLLQNPWFCRIKNFASSKISKTESETLQVWGFCGSTSTTSSATASWDSRAGSDSGKLFCGRNRVTKTIRNYETGAKKPVLRLFEIVFFTPNQCLYFPLILGSIWASPLILREFLRKFGNFLRNALRPKSAFFRLQRSKTGF